MADKQPIESGIIAQVTGAVKNAATKIGSTATAWFGPWQPIEPVVPKEQQPSVIGRQFDYPVGFNQRYRPRSEEAVSFQQMRMLADNCDILRLVIETRKDQVAKMKFSIKPIDEGKDDDSRCEMVEQFLKFPDGENTWADWMRQLVEEMLVTDAATVYPWMTNGGKPFRFELMDGTTLKRVLSDSGRTPAPPQPAYQQILKGVPAVNYTSDEVVYAPRNKRVHKVYGYSPVEQIIMTVNIAIRRSIHQLQFYTEGSTPDLLFQVPAEWNMEQIKAFNDWWQDCLSGNTAQRRKAQFVPGGVNPVNTKEAILKDGYDEWLAKIICYAFSVSSQAFTKEMNRATADTAHQQALQEGLHPVLIWIKDLMDKLIWKYFGFTDLEFQWRNEVEVSPAEQAKIDDINLKNGSATVNEIRARRGDDPVEGGDVAMVLTASGYVPVKYVEPEPMPEPLAAANGNPEGAGVGSNEETPPDEPTPPPKPGKKDQPTEKVEKVKKKLGQAINRDTKLASKVKKTIASEVYEILQGQLKKIKELAIDKVAKDFRDPFDDESLLAWEQFNDLFGEQLAIMAKNGVKQAYVQIELNDPDMLSLANNKAIKYASERAAELVGRKIDADGKIVDNPNAEYNINETTRSAVQADITRAMEEGWSNDELATKLEGNYAFSPERAETIARTETAFADCNGNKILYQESGVVTGKRWIVGDGCCDDCQALDGEEVGLDESFSDGTDVPPAHPNCRCDFVPVISEEPQSEELPF